MGGYFPAAILMIIIIINWFISCWYTSEKNICGIEMLTADHVYFFGKIVLFFLNISKMTGCQIILPVNRIDSMFYDTIHDVGRFDFDFDAKICFVIIFWHCQWFRTSKAHQHLTTKYRQVRDPLCIHTCGIVVDSIIAY